MKKSGFSRLIIKVPACHGASFWRNFTLTWATKILIWAVSNVHTGCRFPTPDLWHPQTWLYILTIYCSSEILASRNRNQQLFTQNLTFDFLLSNTAKTSSRVNSLNSCWCTIFSIFVETNISAFFLRVRSWYISAAALRLNIFSVFIPCTKNCMQCSFRA